MKKYIIKKSNDINEAPHAYIDAWQPGFDYKPECSFRAVHTDDSLLVSLRCFEKNPVAHIDYRNGFVCNDSCMEFFFSPSSDNSAGYFNFEVNSRPAFFLGYAKCAGDKGVLVNWSEEDFNLRTTFDSDETGRDFWQVDFEIPYAMIRKYVPDCRLESGCTIRGNAYKCGCHDQPEHYGSWSPIVSPKPNFHLPEFFGELYLD